MTKIMQHLSSLAGEFLKKRLTYALSAVLLALAFFSGECPEPVTETPLTITKLTINDNSVDLTNPQTQTNVPLSPTIVATFSHAVTLAELGGKLTIGPETSGDNIGISITAGNDKSFIIALAAGVSLSQNTTYILTFKKGLAATIDGVTYSLAQDVSVKFTTQNAHTVTFDAKGGSEVAAISVGDGETLTLPANPAREGHDFAGWFKDEALTQSFAATETINADLTLYAKWTIITYTVTFDSNEGSAVEAKTVNHGDKLALPTAPTRTGYAFEGWYKDNDLTMAFDEMTETITADVTLYAKWVVPFTISNEYIDFHSWYGDVTWNGSATITALMVVSSNATPKAWDGTSALDGNGKLTAAGITGVDVAAIYSRKFTSADSLKTRKVYIGVTEDYTDNSISTLNTAAGKAFFRVSANSDYASIPWIMKRAQQYYLHIYYLDGSTAKTFTHSFQTLDYPADATAANSLFPGDKVASNTNTVYFNTGRATSSNTALELKASEPLILSQFTFYDMSHDLDTRTFAVNGTTLYSFLHSAGDTPVFGTGSTSDNITYLAFHDHTLLRAWSGLTDNVFRLVNSVLVLKNINNGVNRITETISYVIGSGQANLATSFYYKSITE